MSDLVRQLLDEVGHVGPQVWLVVASTAANPPMVSTTSRKREPPAGRSAIATKAGVSENTAEYLTAAAAPAKPPAARDQPGQRNGSTR